MSTRRPSFIVAHWILLARSFVVIFGGVAVGWGVVEFPRFWQESSIERTADRIVAGAPFKAEILARQLSVIDGIEPSSYCRPTALRSNAIIQLRMLEAATTSANDHEHVDERLKSTGNAIRSSLSCSSADPFLWVVLFWMGIAQNESDPIYLKYLRMSYQLGPNEGWIALKRNPVVLANIGTLPSDLAEAGILEFVTLVRSHLYSEAADIAAGLARPIRDLLFTRLRDIKEADRQAFARLLYDRGLDDIPILGTAPTPQHPWR